MGSGPGFALPVSLHAHWGGCKDRTHLPDSLAGSGSRWGPERWLHSMRHDNIGSKSEAVITYLSLLDYSAGESVRPPWHCFGVYPGDTLVSRGCGSNSDSNKFSILAVSLLAPEVVCPQWISFIKFCGHSWMILEPPRTCFFNPPYAFEVPNPLYLIPSV